MVDKLKVFSCDVFVHVPKDERSKFDSKAQKVCHTGIRLNKERIRDVRSKLKQINSYPKIVVMCRKLLSQMVTIDCESESEGEETTPINLC